MMVSLGMCSREGPWAEYFKISHCTHIGIGKQVGIPMFLFHARTKDKNMKHDVE